MKIGDEFINYLKDNITGYHLLYNSLLTEKNWSTIVDMTLTCTNVNFEYKYKTKTVNSGKKLKMSSYRLTNHCDSELSIKKEIKKRNDIDFYFILTKKETKDSIDYEFYIVPVSYIPNDYTWKETYGKTGKYKDKHNGWITNKNEFGYMNITFGSTYQLWIILVKESIKKYKICDINISKNRKLICYSDIICPRKV